MDLPTPLSILLQQGISTLLKLDPETKRALTKVDCKVIRVQVTSPALQFHLAIVDQHVNVMSQFDAEPDTTITGTASDLLSLRSSNSALYKGDVVLSGDVHTGEQLRDVIEGLDIDPEEIIAPITGDAFAHQAGRLGRQFSGWLNETGKSFQRNSSEYLQEEAQIIAPNSEVKHFCKEVDELQAATERLEARIAQFTKNKSRS